MKQTRSNLIKENQSNFKQTQVPTNRSEVNRSHEKLNKSNEIINSLVNVYYEPNNKYKINCFKCSLEKLKFEKCKTKNECLCLENDCENLNELSDKTKIIQEENNNQKIAYQLNKKSSLNNLNQLINKISFNQNEKRLSSSNQSIDEIKLLKNYYQSKEHKLIKNQDNLLHCITKNIKDENQFNENCSTLKKVYRLNNDFLIKNDNKIDDTSCIHMNYKIIKDKTDLFANKKKLSWLDNISKLSVGIKNSLNKSFFDIRENKQIDIKLNNSISEPIIPFNNKKKMKTLVSSNNLNNDLSTSDKTKFTEKIDPQARETWNKKAEFLLAVIGFAVDLGNVWRFPYICYRNGGGAFLIPYFIMMVFGGLPLFYLELALGQYYRTGCLSLWKKICPMMKGIGYAICFIDLYMGMYYNTIIAWALYYFFSSLTTTLPWTHCSNSWNTKNCKTIYERKLYQNNSSNFTSPAQEFFELSVLEISKSSGIEDLGYIKPSMAACLAIIFLMVYFSLWKGVRSTGKAVWFTAIMPYILLTILLIRGLTLEGSLDGIHYFLYPKWSKLLEINVWIDAATQTFFSLGPGFGTLLALSSYNKFNNNCYKDALITSTINCLTSILSGFVIFSVLGFMAKMMNKEIGNVATDGPGLVFIIYPEAIGTMKFSWIWSLFFFLMLITLGLDSTFGGLEAIITGLCDEYPSLLRKNREIFVAFLIIFIYICALPTVTFGGNYIVNLLDTYGTAMSVLFVVLIESITISWLFGTKKIASQIEEMHGNKPSFFWIYCWQFISPVFLFVVFVSAIIRTRSLVLEEYVYPPWSINLGWLITCSSMFCVPVYIIYSFFITKGTFSQRLLLMIRPPPLNISENSEKITNSSQV